MNPFLKMVGVSGYTYSTVHAEYMTKIGGLHVTVSGTPAQLWLMLDPILCQMRRTKIQNL